MIEKIKKYREGILYLVFGGLATVVNFAIYFPLTAIMSAEWANTIAWIGAVSFAFVTNKLWVFKSENKGKALVKEGALFFAARIASLLMENAILWAFITTWPLIEGTFTLLDKELSINNVVIKIISQIAVIVANFFLSKLIIFKKKKDA